MPRILAFIAFSAVFLLQGCLTGSDTKGDSSSEPIDGVWLLTRKLEELNADGSVFRDTTAQDTLADGRTFLWIHGDTCKVLTYDASFERIDTVVLDFKLISGATWRLDGDTGTVSRHGSKLTTRFSATQELGRYTLTQEFKLYAGAFPPVEWLPDTSSNHLNLQSNWMVVRLLIKNDISPSGWDSLSYDTAEADMRTFILVRGDSLYYVFDSGFLLIASERRNATQWWDETTERTSVITLTRADRFLTLESENPAGDSIFFRYELVAYSGSIPLPEDNEPPVDVEDDIYEPNDVRSQAATVPVSTNLLTATLTADDVDWYTFTAVAGRTYRIRTFGDLDTQLWLYKSSGSTVLAEADDEDDLNAVIEWECPVSGTYTFKVEGWAGSTGPYTLSVTRITEVSPKMAVKTARKLPSWLLKARR